MNLYFDAEFTGLHKNTTLISLGIVAENGGKFYAEFTGFDTKQCDDWIRENVISNLFLPELHADSTIIERVGEWKRKGYEIENLPTFSDAFGLVYSTAIIEDGTTKVFGDKEWISKHLKDWLSQFNFIQFVSDVCHYDFVLLIDLFGSAWDLPENVNPACVDINQEIARHYGISEKEAFDKSREEIVLELCEKPVEGKKHNSLYDAEVIKAIYEEIS